MCDIKNEVNGCNNCRGWRTQTLKWVGHVQHLHRVSTMQQAVSKIESGLSIKKPFDLVGWRSMWMGPGPPTLINGDAAAADMSKQNASHVGVTNDLSVFPFEIEYSHIFLTNIYLHNYQHIYECQYTYVWNSTFVFKHHCIYRFRGSIKTLQKTMDLFLAYPPTLVSHLLK